MRIIHVIGTLDPNMGGPPTVIGRIAAAQTALDADVHILAPSCDTIDQIIAQCRETLPGYDRITIHTLDPQYCQNPFFGKHILAKLNPLIKKPTQTVIHIHGIWEPILKHAASCARKHDVPYIIRPCGMLHPWSLAQSKWKKKIALALGYHKMLNSATAIHALNTDEAQYVKDLNLNAACTIIPNGVFLDEVFPLPPKGQYSSSLQSLQGQPYILFLSRLHYKKGLDRLARSFAQLEDTNVQLVIAGPDDGYAKELNQQLNALGIASRVHLVGPLWAKRKYAAMQDAVCFCLPSRQEGFSVAITEALAVGSPAVISEACCFGEVADAGAGYVLDLNDEDTEKSTERLTEALQQVLANHPNEAMRKAGQQLIRERYTWPAIAQQSLKYYRWMLESHHDR